MKATLTLRDLETISGALNRLAAKELPIRVAFKVSMLLKAFGPGIQAFQEAHTELVSRFATRKHNQLIVETPNIPFFNAERTALYATETTVEFDPLPLDDLVDSGITISAIDLGALETLLSTGEEKKKEADA